MSERDWAVIQLLESHRYLTTRQVEGFCFYDHATPLTAARVCRRVLKRLERDGIARALQRRIGGVRAGSASFIWQLAPAGYRLLGGSGHRRPHEPSSLFLSHSLAVAEAHLALVRADRAEALSLDLVAIEPDCWRPYTGLGGSREVLKPDLYAVTADASDPDYELRWFIEIDCGTENPKRLLDKCRRYRDYAATGTEQATGGFPLVLWAMTTTKAADRLTRDIAADPGLDERLFRTTTHDELAAYVAGGGL